MAQNNQQRQQKALHRLAQRQEKNLKFFSEYSPKLGIWLSKVKLTNFRLNYDPEQGDFDVINKGKSVYNNRAKQVGKAEAKQFIQTYHEGSVIKSVPPYPKGSFDVDRYFSRKAHTTLQNNEIKTEEFCGYSLGKFYPQVVFMGVGLGFHIEEMIKRHDIHHVVIAESSIERLFLSLFCVDWQQINNKYRNKKGRSLTFLVSDNSLHDLHALVWNHLIHSVPIFPVSTLFFNHIGDSDYRQIVNEINGDIPKAISGWGTYDDEVNQINNALHNYYRNVRGIPLYRGKVNANVIIVGAGPSLDANIENLKKLQKISTIISCGSALRSLYVHGIKPDIHIEIESNYEINCVMSYINDPDWLKSIRFVGVVQVNPFVYANFEESLCVLKMPSSVGLLLKDISIPLQYSTPTVVNGGISLAAYYRPKRIFLFGVDFGFRDGDKHHSDGTLYDLDTITDKLKKDVQYEKKQRWFTQDIDGNKIQTDGTMYNGKRSVEMLIRDNDYSEIEVFNCSTGVNIEGAKVLSGAEIINNLANYQDVDKRLEKLIFSEKAGRYSEEKISGLLTSCANGMRVLAQQLLKEITRNIKGLESINVVCSSITQVFNISLRDGYNAPLVLLQGSMNHFMFILYTYSLMLENDKSIQNYYLAWRQIVTEFLQDVVGHFESVVFKDFCIDDDKRIKLELWEPETLELA